MKYLFVVILSLIFGLSTFGFLFYAKRMKRRMLAQLLRGLILSRQKSGGWYSSSVIEEVAKQLAPLGKEQLKPILKALKKDNWKPLVKATKNTGLKVIGGGRVAKSDILTRAEMALQNFEPKKTERLLENFNPRGKAEKARLDYLQAALALREGDLLTASAKASAAAGMFNRLNLVYEEANAYLLNGTIYRVSAVDDVADFMFRTAARLFQWAGAKAKEAETLVGRGMLMTAGERYDEAEADFAHALRLYRQIQDERGEAEVLNQQALTALIRGQTTEALKLARQAQSRHRQINNPRGEALSLDLQMQAALANEDWGKALNLSRKARSLYQQNKNLAAELEMTFAEAKILLETGYEDQAEELLRQLLEDAAAEPNCFHVANAYNLLGNIYLRRGDARRAEGLFQQSLSVELHNERWCGAAVDYANIALSAYRRGRKEQGDKNRELALHFAEVAGKEDLKKLFEEKLPNLDKQ